MSDFTSDQVLKLTARWPPAKLANLITYKLMKPGDRVEIHKPEHPSDGKIGVLLHIDESAWPHYAFVAAEDYTPAKVWPTYVVQPRNILVIEDCEREAGAQKVKEIIDAVEAQGRPLRILMGIEGAL